ncbi:MAG: ferric reductase-like transmembrane domain-containing protein [Ilumatobacteraceae bacterium]
MNEILWYLTRATGIVATVLAVAALSWGFLFSARATGNRRRPNWWLDLHNWLGGSTLAFTGAHVLCSFLQSDSSIGVRQVFVPSMSSSDDVSLAWGVVAMYLFAIAVFTSWPKRRFPRDVWRWIHLGSVFGTGLALLHGYRMGTDAGGLIAKAALVILVGVGMYPLGLRLFGAISKRSARSA